VVAASGAGAIVGLLALLAAAPHVPSWPVAEGVRLDGQVIPKGEPLAEHLARREGSARARTVRLRHGTEAFELALGDVGVRIDPERTGSEVHAVAHRGSWLTRLSEARRARRGEVARRIVYTADRVLVRERLRGFTEGFDKAPLDASIDLEKHARTPDVPGRKLDVDATIQRFFEHLDALASGDETEFELIVENTPAAVGLAELQDIDVSKVLGTYETRFSVHKVGRAGNVALAAKKLDGLVLAPGATVSFNERVGPRTRDAGFFEAPEIVGDELTTGIGGGTCQVSSTLYGAALNGGLEIVQRRSHSRPSDYTVLGMDATVKYPTVDLRIKNPYRYTVVVHATLPQPGTLKVELLGGEEVEKVQYSYAVSNVEPFLRRITEKPFLPQGKSMRKQKGTRGMEVHSTVVIRYKDGRSETRTFYSGYKATPEVFWVGPGFDRAELPELPEHAKGVEGEVAAADDVYSG
jgi:vancomycin resistance protein YoaR